MKQITSLIHQTGRSAITYSEYLEEKAKAYNSMPGTFTGFDCKKCLNRGYIEEIRNNTEIMITCECMKKRKALKRLKESGMAGSIREKTFSSFETSENFQQHIKSEAIKFVKDYKGKWFFYRRTKRLRKNSHMYCYCRTAFKIW